MAFNPNISSASSAPFGLDKVPFGQQGPFGIPQQQVQQDQQPLNAGGPTSATQYGKLHAIGKMLLGSYLGGLGSGGTPATAGVDFNPPTLPPNQAYV